MDRYEPYYAPDTEGVHFLVCVDGLYVQAHVSRAVLTRRYGREVDPSRCVELYLANSIWIDAAVARRVRSEGPETVVLRVRDLAEVP